MMFAVAQDALLGSGKKPLESLLVDDVILESQSAAFQVGPEAKAEIKTIVVENAKILGSKRGLSLQLHDSADMHDIWCCFLLNILSVMFESIKSKALVEGFEFYWRRAD